MDLDPGGIVGDGGEEEREAGMVVVVVVVRRGGLGLRDCRKGSGGEGRVYRIGGMGVTEGGGVGEGDSEDDGEVRSSSLDITYEGY